MKNLVLVFGLLFSACSFAPLSVRDEIRIPESGDKAAWSRAHSIIGQERIYYYSDDYLIAFNGECPGIDEKLDYQGKLFREYGKGENRYILIINSSNENQFPLKDEDRQIYLKYFDAVAKKIKAYIVGSE